MNLNKFLKECNKKEVFKRFNLEIKKNTIVGIKGATGKGKSTLGKIILCLLDPYEGYIEIDETKINSNNYIMKTKFNGFLTLLLAFMVQISFAQEKTVTGTVSDASGPLPGVTVIIKGTKTGTQTDFDGKTTTFDPIAISVNQNEDNFQDVKLYPNPLIDNKVNILLPIPQENEIGFFINDLIGKQYVSDITLINMGDQTMVILEFSERPPSGTYLISVIINNEIITKKLLLE